MTIRTTGRSRSISLLVTVLVAGAAAAMLCAGGALGQQAARTGAIAQHPPHRHLGGTVRDFEFSSITPAGSVEAGNSGSATVVISRQGGHSAAIALEIAANAQGITGSGSVPSPGNSGSLTYSVPPAAAAGSHVLTVNGSDGTRAHSSTFGLTVTVVPAVINSFTATPPSIAPGGQSSLAYSFTGGSGSIDHGVGSVTSGGSTNVSPAATTTYTLTVTPVSGPTVQQQATVTVTEPGNATMSSSRAYQSETLLPNGKVLLAGGTNDLFGLAPMAGADLYNPASGLLNPTGPMGAARYAHTATLLNNGKVLVVGGFVVNKTDATASAELYDPAAGTFAPTANTLHYPRGGHTATLLPNGEVLIVGGYSGKTNVLANYPSTCEIYNPVSNLFRDSGSLNAVRGAHRATPIYGLILPVVAQSLEHADIVDNRVLISGGYSANGFITSLEWYFVGSDSFGTLSVGLGAGRALHTAVLLPNNKVLLAGGAISTSLPPSAIASAELYNVLTNSIAPTGSLVAARAAQTSTLVGGRVLVFGGAAGFSVLSSVESYDPGTGQFTAATAMATGRGFHTGTLLGNGKILLAGGLNTGAPGFFLNTVQAYTPSP
jgi:hypothetical protein